MSFWGHLGEQKAARKNGIGLGVALGSTLPETKPASFTPENGWLEDDPFLLGRLIFRSYVSEGIFFEISFVLDCRKMVFTAL